MLLPYLLVLDDIDSADEFVSVYRTYRKQMIYIAYGILNNTYDAEDAVQSAFMGISANFSKIRSKDPDALCAYCCRAAKNSALSLLEKRNGTAPSELSLAETAPDRDSDILGALTERESFDAIVRAIRSLPETYRDVLCLYYVDELTAAETARVLSRNPQTVKKQIARGKKLLIELLRKEGISHE